MGQKIFFPMILLFACSAVAQTPMDLQTRYGKPVTSYIVSDHILMTPEYTMDGKVCMMRLHPRPYSSKVNFVSAHLPFSELTKVLNELVPLRTRGAKKDPFDTGATGAGAEWRTYEYENVKFSFLSSFRPDPESWKTRKEFVFTIDPDLCLRKPSQNPQRRPKMISLPVKV